MTDILDFKTKEAFRKWLESNHNCGHGVTLFLYKKGYESLGITYEEAVRTALCYGWIDAVTHSYDETKFKQYFAKRKINSNWSISNIKRMKDLLEEDLMTKYGLEYFDMELIDQLDDMIADEIAFKTQPLKVPDFIAEFLLNEHALDLLYDSSKSAQKMYLHYILSAKKEETKLRRCYKIADILKGGKNNL
ncbi:MAG: YdeI/OmpD-associated family protein [Clostridiales bacterium]|nr:YdeI/OmpD-associated family protein [Clostridiales bacterium]